MRILKNENKYLSTEIIEQCFEYGKTNFVDKVVTGNGFTTTFSFLQPKQGKVNVLVAPNRSVVKDKEKEYANRTFAPKKKVGFVYEGSSLKHNVNYYDLIVLVSDSFVNIAWKLKGNIDKLMIDEFHSVLIQSSFRNSLKKIQYKLEEDFKDCSIAFVTASPLLYSDIDITIDNKLIKPRELHTTQEVDKFISRAVESIKNNKKVLLFSQDASVVKKILTLSDHKEFRLISGDNFLGTLLSKDFYTLNEKSNVVVCSSAAFEGWSDYSLNGDIFIYMNLNNAHNTFLGANIYQAIGRLREGYNYAEICVQKVGGGFPNKCIQHLDHKLDTFINYDRQSIERKQSKSFKFNFRGQQIAGKDLMSYIYTKHKDNLISFHKYKPAIQVHNEVNRIDNKLQIYTEYFAKREVKLIEIETDISSKKPMAKTKREQKIEHIVENIKTNNLIDLFDVFFFKNFNPEDKAKYYIEEIDIYQECAFHLGIELDVKYQLLKEFMQEGYYSQLLEIYIRKATNKNKVTEKRKEFTDVGYNYCLDVAIGITFGRFDVNIVGHRNYNSLTLIGLTLVEFIANKLDKKITEIDIKNCFPRIIYALNDLPLPVDFYGKDRAKNKMKINALLNNFFYDESKATGKNKQKNNAKSNLKKAGIHSKCVDWLIDNHFENEFRGDLFNFMAYHEKEIIKLAIDILQIKEPEELFFRRHDSIIVFKDFNHKELNNFMYQGQEGWFKESKENIFTDEFFEFT